MNKYLFIRAKNEDLETWLNRAISYGIFNVKAIEWSAKNENENRSSGNGFGSLTDYLGCQSKISEYLLDTEMICYDGFFEE